MMHPGETFLSDDWHGSTRNLGGVLAAFLRARFPRDTIKRSASALDCTLPAAANATKGHASERILTKAFQAWPDEFGDAVTEAFTGLTRAERLRKIIEQEAADHEAMQSRLADALRLETRALDLLRLRNRTAA